MLGKRKTTDTKLGLGCRKMRKQTAECCDKIPFEYILFVCVATRKRQIVSRGVSQICFLKSNSLPDVHSDANVGVLICVLFIPIFVSSFVLARVAVSNSVFREKIESKRSLIFERRDCPPPPNNGTSSCKVQKPNQSQFHTVGCSAYVWWTIKSGEML